MFRRTAGVGGGEPDHACAHRHHRIGGQPPDMALPEHRAGRDIGGPGFFDGQRHRPGVDVKSKTPVAVDHRRGRRFLHDRPWRAGNDVPGPDAVDIGRDRDDSVRVVARQVGVDAAGCDGLRFLVRRPGGPEQRRANARQTVGLHDRHGSSSFHARAEAGLACCRPRMVSKQRPDGNDLVPEILPGCDPMRPDQARCGPRFPWPSRAPAPADGGNMLSRTFRAWPFGPRLL